MNEFSNIVSKDLDYHAYWEKRESDVRPALWEREKIFFDWIPKGTRVLDIACGNSALPSFLKQEKNCDVTVFDISNKVIEKQKLKGLKTEVEDVSSEMFGLEDTYDYIVLSEILEHLPQPEKLIKKVMPHGRYLIISIPNSAFYRFRIRLLIKGKFLKQWAFHPSEHLRFWSHSDFIDWLDALGLRVVRSDASNGLDIGPIKFYSKWPNLFGHQICYFVEKK